MYPFLNILCGEVFPEGVQKECTNVFLHITKVNDPRVENQARVQNDRSRALKWGIIHLCKSNGFGDMIKDKICNFLEFSHFSQFSIVVSALFYKMANFEKFKFL